MLCRFPRGHSPFVTPNPQTGAFPDIRPNIQSHPPDVGNTPTPTRSYHVRLASDPIPHDAAKRQRIAHGDGLQRAATMSLRPGGPANGLHINSDPRFFSNQEMQDSATITKTPRSPGPNKLTSFFGWKTSSPIAEISPSTYSGRSHSPNPSHPSHPPSPLSHSPHGLTASKKYPQAIDVPKANAHINASYFAETGFPLPPQTQPVLASAQIADMEEELREVSSELAGSIRRELELEDLVDRLQFEVQQGPELSRRTSDYFSDSGTSSVRYPHSEVGGGKTEDVARMKRTSEQEKAQFKLNMSQKLQDERARRKVLEFHVQQLGEQVQNVSPGRMHIKAPSNSFPDG